MISICLMPKDADTHYSYEYKQPQTCLYWGPNCIDRISLTQQPKTTHFWSYFWGPWLKIHRPAVKRMSFIREPLHRSVTPCLLTVGLLTSGYSWPLGFLFCHSLDFLTTDFLTYGRLTTVSLIISQLIDNLSLMTAGQWSWDNSFLPQAIKHWSFLTDHLTADHSKRSLSGLFWLQFYCIST